MYRFIAVWMFIAAVLCSVHARAQTAPPQPGEPPAYEAPLTNGEIVKLTKAGLGDGPIVAKIKQATSETLDVATDALITLRQKKVSSAVTEAMVERVAKDGARAETQAVERQKIDKRAQAMRDSATSEQDSVDAFRLRWVEIPAGDFQMGCSPGDSECFGIEAPTLLVKIARPFEMNVIEVTVAQFRTYVAASGAEFPEQPWWSDDAKPVVNVTWDDAVPFCTWAGGRLPTETEWEYAARAGSEEARYGPVDSVAWYANNAGRERLDSTNARWGTYGGWDKTNDNRAHEGARKLPNAFGLYDMLGNVWEWCEDSFDPDSPNLANSVDREVSASAIYRVIRGGSWDFAPSAIRASFRGWVLPARRSDDIGFRCVRDAK